MTEGKNNVAYTCYITNGYLFAEIDGLGKVLVDSNSPVSMSDKPFVAIMDRQFHLTKSIMGQSASTISKLIDTEIDALIGSNILSQFDVFIDIGEGHLTLSEELLGIKGIKEPLEYPLDNVPVLNLKIKGKMHRFIIDTGARLSYIKTELAERYQITGKNTDYFPGFGKFETEIREIPVTIAGSDLTLIFGTLPEILEMTLTLPNADGIIGTEIFDYFNIGLSKRTKEITFVAVEGLEF